MVYSGFILRVHGFCTQGGITGADMWGPGPTGQRKGKGAALPVVYLAVGEVSGDGDGGVGLRVRRWFGWSASR